MADDEKVVTRGEAFAVVAEEGGPEAVSLLADLMEHNQRDIEWSMAQQIGYLERKVETLTEQRNAAWDKLDKITRRVAWLMEGDDILIEET